MGLHVHRQIREAVVAALSAIPGLGGRVHANRLYPFEDTSLPALRVYLDDEEAETITVNGPTLLDRVLSLSVEICAKAAQGLDDDLDGLALEVEKALAGGIACGSRTLYPLYAGMRYEDDATLEKPVAVKRLMFRIRFQAMNDTPDTFA